MRLVLLQPVPVVVPVESLAAALLVYPLAKPISASALPPLAAGLAVLVLVILVVSTEGPVASVVVVVVIVSAGRKVARRSAAPGKGLVSTICLFFVQIAKPGLTC